MTLIFAHRRYGRPFLATVGFLYALCVWRSVGGAYCQKHSLSLSKVNQEEAISASAYNIPQTDLRTHFDDFKKDCLYDKKKLINFQRESGFCHEYVCQITFELVYH